jgi:hypothetical protein
MAILNSPETEEAKERVKWEAQSTAFGPGQRPYEYREYPKMLSKAGRNASGVPIIVDTTEVQSETQEANLRSRGYHPGQETALAALHAADQEAAILAANRAYSDRRMSPQAQAEADAIDRQTAAHLPVIPERPIKRRYHKRPKPQKEAAHADQ